MPMNINMPARMTMIVTGGERVVAGLSPRNPTAAVKTYKGWIRPPGYCVTLSRISRHYPPAWACAAFTKAVPGAKAGNISINVG